MRDIPMQRYCSELSEKLLKSLDKEYNVSKAVVCRGEMHRAVSVSVRANGYRATLDPPCAVLLPVPVTCAREPRLCVLMCVCGSVAAATAAARVYECRRGLSRGSSPSVARHCVVSCGDILCAMPA